MLPVGAKAFCVPSMCNGSLQYVHVVMLIWMCLGGKFINTNRDNGLGNIWKHPALLNYRLCGDKEIRESKEDYFTKQNIIVIC